MISVGGPVQWNDFTGSKTNIGVRDRLHEQFDDWLNILEGEMEEKERKH